ncbi:MAG: 30S ribosomal protein S15 [Marine Group III euryarchaeote CG-Bathy1]|uniref:Small ribosomal subunit protein uS15 n=1 Tax=Marine Group III euryarchaeote CG-Bathy1 TaxID=1889001 RepID=A0A1J5TSF3_9ARCH|nr:MAG: 30S ribosomal protein S15 [Marine Group III euryarchaeote CG-Bathy1]
MARIHARKKGRSGSHAINRDNHPSWSPVSSKDVETLVIEKSKEGLSTAQIGAVLRDAHGIPSVKLATNSSINGILKKNNLSSEIPEDLSNMMRKAVRLGEHLDKNPKDIHNKRALQLTESKIMRLVGYYKDNSVLPSDWKYSLATAKLTVG